MEDFSDTAFPRMSYKETIQRFINEHPCINCIMKIYSCEGNDLKCSLYLAHRRTYPGLYYKQNK